MEAVKKFENWAAPIVLIMAAILLVWLVVKAKGLGSMLHKPSKFQTFHEFWIVFIPSLTSNIFILSKLISLILVVFSGTVGFWSTLALNIPDFTRFGRSQRDQILGQSLGLPLTMLVFSAMAVIITSTAQDVLVNAPGNLWDPVYLLSVITSPSQTFFSTATRIIIAIVSLLGILIATVSVNISANVVSPANDFANLSPRHISFKTGGLITCILAVVIMPWKLLASSEEYIFTWLIGYSALLGPIAGILIGDYYLLKKQKIEITELYCDAYSLCTYRAINWTAMLALVIGIVPNIPGFIKSLQLHQKQDKDFFDQIYVYAWFIGLFLAGFVYVVAMLIHRRMIFDKIRYRF
jgi:NCS1 family nucleobase:cation symporter-1